MPLPRKRPNGTWVIQINHAQKRTQISLGKISDEQASFTGMMVNKIIESSKSQTSFPPEVETWLASIPDALATKLNETGLIKNQHRDLTFSQLIALFVEFYDKSEKACTETKIRMRTSLKRLPMFVRDVQISKVTPQVIADIENYVLSNWAIATAGRTHGDMLQAGIWAVNNNYAKKNPFDGLTRFESVNANTDRYIDEDIVRRIVAVTACPNLRTSFVLARFAGLRIMSELMQLTWDQYNPDEKVLIIRKSKSRLDRSPKDVFKVVPLWPYLDRILTEQWETTAEFSQYIITEATLRTTATAFRQKARRAIKRAGYDPWPKPWQNLRKSYSQDVRKRFNVEAGAAMTGHSPEVALRNYKAAKRNQVDVQAAIDSGLFGVD